MDGTTFINKEIKSLDRQIVNLKDKIEHLTDLNEGQSITFEREMRRAEGARQFAVDELRELSVKYEDLKQERQVMVRNEETMHVRCLNRLINLRCDDCTMDKMERENMKAEQARQFVVDELRELSVKYEDLKQETAQYDKLCVLYEENRARVQELEGYCQQAQDLEERLNPLKKVTS